MENKEISNELVIAVSTVKNHVSSIISKMGVANRTEVIMLVLEHNVNLGAFNVT